MEATGGSPPVRTGDRDRRCGGFAAGRFERLGDPLRVLRDRPDRDARPAGHPVHARGAGPDQPLRPQVGLGRAREEHLQVEVVRRISSASSPTNGIRTVALDLGKPRLGPWLRSTPPIGGTTSESYWRAMLRAMVARYGPGRRLLEGPVPPAVRSQRRSAADPGLAVWNEPNLKKFFAPNPSPGKYGHLLQISHDAIKSKDPNAQIVAGRNAVPRRRQRPRLPEGHVLGAEHQELLRRRGAPPLRASVGEMQQDIQKYRSVMASHGDATKPLWLTELAWGSAPPDSFGINKGPAGQAQLLTRAYKLILDHRAAWNIQRLFWYHWRDPQHTAASCSFCGSAGLLNFDRSAKPAYAAFTNFTADTTKPTATITGGPANGSFTNDPTPLFKFSLQRGGLDLRLLDRGRPESLQPRPTSSLISPTAPTSSSPGRSTPRATRARWPARYFTVDTRAPATPKITSTNPASPAERQRPEGDRHRRPRTPRSRSSRRPAAPAPR